MAARNLYVHIEQEHWLKYNLIFAAFLIKTYDRMFRLLQAK